MRETETQKRHYKRIASKYFSARQSTNHILFQYLLWDNFLCDKPFLKKNGVSVLEPMCGFAGGKKIIEEHLTKDFSYEGFDNCDDIVDAAKKQYPGLHVFQMDATKFRPTRTYDLVIVIGGLHHIPDHAREFIDVVHGALVDGGYFINFEPTENNSIARTIRKSIYSKNKMFDAETERAFETGELNEIYGSGRFQIIDQIYPGLASYVLYYNPEAFPSLNNIGGASTVKLIFNIDRFFFRTFIGRYFSFATLTLLKKIDKAQV